MKLHYLKLAATALVAFLALTSCKTHTGAYGRNADMVARTKLTSINEYDLNISETPVEYVIDISTESGAAKLRGLSRKEAEDLVLREAIMKYKCALLFNPQYKYSMKGKRVLGIKVYGFPAVYKNQK